MDWSEAEHVRLIIQDDAPSLPVELRQIGNGEWVCVLNGGFWIWNEENWEANQGTATIAVNAIIA